MPIRYRVRIAAAAERDLGAIYDYVAQEASPARADKVFERLREQIQGLALEPERGSWPSELLALGLRDFRQLVVRPWRVFYRVEGDQVVVLLIADGRRSLKTLLERRLLGC
jgi:toxin ParE1/3/4